MDSGRRDFLLGAAAAVVAIPGAAAAFAGLVEHAFGGFVAPPGYAG